MVTLGRGDAAELGHDLAALIRLHNRRDRHESGVVAVEIGLARLEVFVPALAAPDLAFDVLDEDKRAGAEDVGFRKVRVFR